MAIKQNKLKLTSSIKTLRIKNVSDLAPYLDAWNELSAGMPMRSAQWFITWWNIYAESDDELSVLLFLGPKNVLVGVAPLYLQSKSAKAIFRLLGSGENFTHHSTWLTAPGWESEVGKEVAHFFLQSETEWKQILIQAVDEDASAIHVTMNHLAENGCVCHKRQIQSCWRILLPPTWDGYLMTLSRSLRKRCRKISKQYLDSGKIVLRQVDNETDLAEGLDILMKLHGARWGKAEKPFGIFDDMRFRTFHETFSKYLLDNKSLRLAWLECDNVPIAIEYQFVDTKTVYAYQAGIDLSKDLYSSGKLSMIAAIQYAILHGCEFFDFLSGNDPYKANWRATPVYCYDLRAWHPHVRGFMSWTAWHGYTIVSKQLKSIIPHRHIIHGLKLLQSLKSYGQRKPRYEN